jgi:hypothetical protein
LPGDLLPRGHPSNDDLVLQGLLPWQLRLWIWIPMLEISRPTSRWQFGFGLKMREKFLELPGEYFMFLVTIYTVEGFLICSKVQCFQ